jgi:hypothetical protein
VWAEANSVLKLCVSTTPVTTISVYVCNHSLHVPAHAWSLLCEKVRPHELSDDSELSFTGHNVEPKISPGTARQERPDRAHVIHGWRLSMHDPQQLSLMSGSGRVLVISFIEWL